MNAFQYRQYRKAIEDQCAADLKALDRVYAIAQKMPQVSIVSMAAVESIQKPTINRTIGIIGIIRRAIASADSEFMACDIWNNVTKDAPNARRGTLDNELYSMKKLGKLESVSKGIYRKVAK